jgi:hypothetical protein
MAGKSSSRGGKGGSAGKTSAGKAAMTTTRASAIQSKAMKTTGTVKAGSFPARTQSAAAHNVNAGIVRAVTTRKP